ncbi:putative mitochondrial protein [Vitis vinifera]|uniref:Putative mitochondrial protein n=1 Tax=Vitis vinifera TaxID=29760 RepID=A0A438ELU0_VITVI|nr:putative mitochondrial protein [Vitis vinifera]
MSRELWLKEEDKNTGFFHQMANAHRRNNSMEKIKINGRWLEEEQEVREGVVNAFQQLLSEEPAWKADIEGLNLQRLNHIEAEGLEQPFTEEETHAALMGMNGDKAPGPDGFTVAFWQSCFRQGGLCGPNAFVKGRQILDASLTANEVMTSSINVKMGFGACWMEWIWWCISTANFSILVNGVPAGYFSNSRGLRQGDPLSPYLFVLGMEVLSALLRRVVDGGFISGCSLRGREGMEMNVSHLLFDDDTIIFCEARQDHLTYLSWILAWFEAVSGLKINLAKSEVILVGEVEDIEELAVEIGCRVGALPTVYLGLPLGANHKATTMWDRVEVRMRRRLALWKRQYLSKGGRITLIKSTLASDRVKYGYEGFGWRTNEARGTFGVGVWKEILKESYWCWDNIEFKVGEGTKVNFWLISSAVMRRCPNFPQSFALAAQRNASVNEMWDSSLGQGGELFHMLRDLRISPKEDSVIRKGGGHGLFRIRDAYKLLTVPSAITFPKKGIWVDKVPTKSCFFCLGGYLGEGPNFG